MRNVKLQHIDFRWVWSKVLPQVYDDSLSYYEQLCKLGAALDTLATQCEEHFTEIYALIEIINDEIARLKERMDDAEANIADLILRTGVLREDVDRLLQLAPDITVLEGKVAHLEGGNVGEVLAKHSSTNFDFQWKLVRGVPAYGSSNEGQLLSVIYDGDTYELDWIDAPTDIPSYYATDDGKVLKIRMNGSDEPEMFWGLGLPELADAGADANKILGVNGTGDGIEWKVQEGTIPGYAYSDRNKALCVNASATGVEWATRQDELPEYSLDESNWVLSVNGTGDGLYWQNNKVLGVEAFEGSGEPASTIKAKTGDIYRDVSTNKLYWCDRYIDPENITDLTYLGIQFNNSPDISTTGAIVGSNIIYELNYKDEYQPANLRERLSFSEWAQGFYSMYYGTTLTPLAFAAYDYSSGWVNNGCKIIHIEGGNDATNPDLITWLSANGTILGAGSHWVEVSPDVVHYVYDEPISAPSFRATGDYTLSGNATPGQRVTVYLTGASVGTYGTLYVENTTSHYVKKYEFLYLGDARGIVVDNNSTTPPATEDWYIEQTPTSNGYLVLNANTYSLNYKVTAVYDYKP